jgi:hypothetical protein
MFLEKFINKKSGKRIDDAYLPAFHFGVINKLKN